MSAEDHRALLSLEDRLPVNTLALFRLMALRTLVTEFQQKEQREQKELSFKREVSHSHGARATDADDDHAAGASALAEAGDSHRPPPSLKRKMSTVPEEEQRQIFGAVGSFFAKASAAMSDALGRASKGDSPSRGWLAAIGHRMRGGARFMGCLLYTSPSPRD